MNSLHPLRLYRQQKNLSLDDIAKAVGRSAASISRVEAGTQKPSPDFAKAIHKHTTIPLWQLRPDIWSADNGAAA